MSRRRDSAAEEHAEDAGDDPFVKQLTEALKHFTDPQWLGLHSPLATPYMLGSQLAGQAWADTSTGRGQVLQRVLLEAAHGLGIVGDGRPVIVDRPRQADEAPGTARYHHYRQNLLDQLKQGQALQRLLYWRYFQPQPGATVEHIIDLANLSATRSHYHRLRKEAIRQLANTLLYLVHPALRLERPPPSVALIGRAQARQAAERALRRRQTVAITGSGGSGKTAFAAALAAQVAPQATFWFTIRPGVNDHLATLLYEFAFFLAQHGQASLWRQLAAEGGGIPRSAPAVLRFDLAQLDHPVLLCFDELDLLRPVDGPTAAPILALLQDLREHVPLVVIGQRLSFDSDVLCSLDGLSLLDIHDLLGRAHVTLSSASIAELHRMTGGNPRLLELFLSLHRVDTPLSETLSDWEGSVSLRSLLARMLRRLNDDERRMLRALAVYRSAAPEDIWDAESLQTLEHLRLAQRDGPGRVSVIPAFRGLIYAQLPPQERRRLHAVAASVYQVRGTYTAAAYHYLKADQPAAALWTWQPHRTQALQQGQGAAALALLQQIPADRLSTEDQRVLALELGDLLLLVGQPAQGAEVLQRVAWPPHHPNTAHAQRIMGTSADLQGDLDRARVAYRSGLRTMTHLAREIAIFHKNLSWVARRQRNLDEAWREACLARYEAVNMQGYIEEDRGAFASAHSYYLEALALAQQWENLHGQAKTCNNLARLTGRMNRSEEALAYTVQAVRLSQQIGDRSMTASIQVNLALTYNQARRPVEAIGPAREALAFFDQSDQTWGKTAAAQNLAEAHLALNQLDQAVLCAEMVVAANEPATLPDGLRVLGEIALARGEIIPAARWIIRAIRAAWASNDRFLEAYAWRSLTRVFLARGKPRAARSALERAIAIFQELGLPHEVTSTMDAWQ